MRTKIAIIRNIKPRMKRTATSKVRSI